MVAFSEQTGFVVEISDESPDDESLNDKLPITEAPLSLELPHP